MTEINDKINFRRFIARIFISDSGVSSRRVAGFMTLISLLFLVFFKYPIDYVNIIALLTIGFFGLTTISSMFQPKKEDETKG